RLHSNSLHCDCHLSWLSDWLRQRRGLAPFTQCMAPAHMRGLNVPDVQKREFVCTGPAQTEPRSCAPQASICPAACTCNNNIIDCRRKGLTEIPANLPEGIVEIRLEQNMIKSIPAGAFSTYKKLKRIWPNYLYLCHYRDLSKNQISEIAEDAFSGLRSLTSLVLYGNKIAEIPKGLFDGLVSLQLLHGNIAQTSFLHLMVQIESCAEDANKINCLRVNTFNRRCRTSTCFPLWTTSFSTISKRPVHPLRAFKHCAEDYTRVVSARVGFQGRLVCPSAVGVRERGGLLQPQLTKSPSPAGAHHRTCTFKSVKFHGQKRRLNDNEISVLEATGAFKKLPNLRKINLSNNKLRDIREGAFDGAGGVLEMLLTGNKLQSVSGRMFKGLSGLKTLMLRSNQISCVDNATFTGLSSVRLLSLYDNRISTIAPGAFNTLHSLSTM
ncbi:hypothetical protein cypCar_00009827, partial [Cyprinus carpio]